MRKFTAHILLITLVVIFGICECADDCFYRSGYSGKRCSNEHTAQYTCCPLDYQCQDGKCLSLGGSQPFRYLPLRTSVLIGVGACAFAVVCIVIIGIVFRHRKQMKITQRPLYPMKSFSYSEGTASRTASSAAFGTHTSTGVDVSVQIPSTNNPKGNI